MAEYYQKNMRIGASLCGADGKMSIPGAFAIFQDLASEHAEQMGIGFEHMKENHAFWVTVRTRVRLERRPEIMAQVTLETWPAAPGKVRCDRFYRMRSGDALLAEGRTEWCVVNTETGSTCPLEGVFDAETEYREEKLLDTPYARFRHNFTDADCACSYVVRTSDIDLGRHMNNVAYLRLICDSFSVAELEDMNVRELEIMFLSSCYEGDHLEVMRRRTDAGFEFGVRRADGRYAALAQLRTE